LGENLDIIIENVKKIDRKKDEIIVAVIRKALGRHFVFK
jgi:hypothetical protein